MNLIFFCFTSVEDLIDYIEDNSDYFKFKLFYVVVSGRLAEGFFEEYVKLSEKYNTIANTTVYYLKQKIMKRSHILWISI